MFGDDLGKAIGCLIVLALIVGALIGIVLWTIIEWAFSHVQII